MVLLPTPPFALLMAKTWRILGIGRFSGRPSNEIQQEAFEGYILWGGKESSWRDKILNGFTYPVSSALRG